MFYSASRNAWYDPTLKAEYEKTGTWPNDAKEYSRAVFDEVVSNRTSEEIMVPDPNGDPIVINRPDPSIDDSSAALVKQIDADADAIYTAALGNRATEYAEAESQAQAYKDAAYAGDVPPYVKAWADATGKSAQWSADDILATTAAWRTAQAAIRAQRLAAKEAARKAEDAATLAAVATQWSAFVTAIKAQLGL